MLQPEHPDYERLPKDQYTAKDGTVWTFGQNQYMKFWRAGPKDGTVACSMDYPHASDHPYRSGGRSYPDMEKALTAARRNAKAEYERALEIVRRYES